MTLYAHLTETCLQNASMHNVVSQLENIKTQILSTQKLVGFTPFRPTRIIRKNMGRSFRLLAYDARCGEDSLIVFIKIVPRSDDNYNWLLKNHDNKPEQAHQKFLNLSQDEITEIYLEEVEQSKDSIKVYPDLLEAENNWLYDVFAGGSRGISTDDLLVLESKQWIEEILSPQKADFLISYRNLLDETQIDDLEPSSSITDIKFIEDKEIALLYVFFPQYNQLFLIFPLVKNGTENILEKIDEFKDFFSGAGVPEDSNQFLLRFSSRSYPFFMILDRDAWLGIQRNREANLALSPEEGELLESIRSSKFDRDSYPLFINGRAGSGKSTILQYLMTDFVEFYLKNSEVSAPDSCQDRLYPVYMTYSADLLKSARETVRGVLECHFAKLLEGTFSKTKIDDILNRLFVVFHDFLLSLLPEDVKSGFLREKFVSYTEFQRLWNLPGEFGNRPESKNVEPSLAWHIIRSYIKGISSEKDENLSPEEFMELPKKRRSVKPETYQFVYDRVWLNWYQPLCENNGYWDEQDLVATVLNCGAVDDLNCAAILCDEAQDFTPLELEFILQISVFSKRKIDLYDQLRRIPFVFAGDPLQTLNPTGFRWENIQADFYDRFSSILDPSQRSNVNITYKELQFNYRSNPGIVNFCNLIQLLRLCLIGGQNIHPQKSWWIERPVQVIWFDIEDLNTQEQIKNNPDIIKIVNCDIGGETEYVQNDSILREIQDYEENTYQNVLSSGRSKGLEFSRVILYRFGESAPDRFDSLLSGDSKISDDPEKCLPYEYFLNRLYVAASRAKKQLIIVDSKKVIEKFWKFATEHDRIVQLGRSLNHFENWLDKLAYLLRGSSEAWTGETVDILAQANEYKMQGIHARDPYLLRQAALSFRSISQKIEAIECFAQAYKIENKHQEAGDIYKQSGLSEPAFAAYWEGQKFSSIKELVAEYPSLISRRESRAADFMCDPSGVPAVLLSDLFQLSQDEKSTEYLVKDLTWHSVLTELAKTLGRLHENNFSNWFEAYNLFKSFYQIGINFDPETLGQIAFRARRLSEAVKYFEKAGKTDRKEYYQAQAELKDFPERLLWLRKLNHFSDIIEEWNSHPEAGDRIAQLSREVAMAVCDAAITKADEELTFKILEVYPDRPRALQVCDKAIANRNYHFALKILDNNPDSSRLEQLITIGLRSFQNKHIDIAKKGTNLLVKFLFDNKQWETGLNLLNGRYASPTLDSGSFRRFTRRDDISKDLLKTAVIAWAVSESLPQETPENQSRISEFLFQRFLAQKPYQSVRDAGLSLKLVGAAIERGKKFTNALQFYGSMQTYRHLSDGELQLINERTIVNLEKYAEYLHDINQFNQAEDRIFRARELRKNAGFGNELLPEYPEISDRDIADLDRPMEPLETPTKPQPKNWKYGDLSCRYSSEHQKLRVEHQEQFQVVILSLPGLQLQGDADFEPIAPTEENEVVARSIATWDTTIRIFRRNEALEIHLKTGDAEPLILHL